MKPSEIRGHAIAKRALTIAWASGHSVMLWGPRNAGKHTLAEAYEDELAGEVTIMDSCPCGQYGSIIRSCRCTPVQLRRWANRFDRLAANADIIVEVPHVPTKELMAPLRNEPDHSEARVLAARLFGVDHDCRDLKEDSAIRTMEMASRRLSLTAGQFRAVIRVARTIANLDASSDLRAKHVAEAIQYQAMCGRVYETVVAA